MAGLTIKTTFAALNKMTQPITTMQGQVTRFASHARKATEGIGASFNRLRGIIGLAIGGLGVHEAIKGITEFAEKGDEIERMSKVLGMSASSLQELRFAAKMADISTGDFDTALKKMNMNLGQLRSRQGTLYTALAKTNPRLAMQLKNAKDSDQAFTLLSEAISKQTDPAKRASLAVAAFGRSGQALIPMLLDGSAGLEKFRDEARRTGLVMGDDATKSAASLADSIKRLKMQGQSLLNTVLSKIVVKITPLVEKFLAWADANRELIGQKINDAIDKITKAISDAYNIVKTLNDLMGGHLLRNLLLVAGAWKSIQVAIALATTAQAAFNLIKGAGSVAGAAGSVAGAAGSAGSAGMLAALGAAGPVLGGAAILASVYYGASQYVKNPTAANLNPNNALLKNQQNMNSPIAGYMAGMMTPALAGALNKQNEPAKVQIDFTNMPAGVEVRSTNTGKGAPAVTLPLGRAWH